MKFDGKRLREERKKRGLTLHEVAFNTGIILAHVGFIETETTAPSFVKAMELLTFYGLQKKAHEFLKEC